ncbi:MAG: zinc ribbon domain-containing protein [Clostridia bacterium]|nr:zinc ribbon domain-containing protein [Clostridia bacterium]
MFCTDCGKAMADDALFCPYCGARRIVMPPAEVKKPVDTEAEAPMEEASIAEAPEAGREESAPHTAPSTAFILQDVPPPATPVMERPGAVIAPKPKKHMPKWLLIVLGALFGVVLILAGLFLWGLFLLEEEETAANVPEEAAAPISTPLVQQDGAAIAQGERLYAGHGSCEGIENLEFSFVLSKDRSYIHDVKLGVSGLSGEANGLSVSVSKMTEHYQGEFSVDYEANSNSDIELGHSTIRHLAFFGEEAEVDIDYVFYSSGVGLNAQSFEIPFGSVYFLLTVQDGTEDAPDAKPTPMPTPAPTPDVTRTEFDSALLKNWDSAAMREAFDVDSIYAFHPAHPENRNYIVCAEGGVYDPVTKAESEGGYNRANTRHKPVGTGSMLATSGDLLKGGLILTDDPQKATYALVLDFSYTNNIGKFRFNGDGSTIKQYNATLDATLINLITGESIESEQKKAFATHTGESVRTSMLDAAKGKQLYSDAPTLAADDFEGYWDFVHEWDAAVKEMEGS